MCVAMQLPPILHDPTQHWAVSDECRDLACRIPRLDDVLDALPHDMPMIIELKHKSKVRAERESGGMSWVRMSKERVMKWFVAG